MPRGRGIENDVIEARGRVFVTEQLCELVESSYLDGAGAGELLLHAGDRRGRELAPIGPDHALAVVPCRFFRIDVEGK
jgi:hypothetical protein